MRFCISGKQPFAIINKADEIKFDYEDRERIIDIVENYSNKIVILNVPGNEADWDSWITYTEKLNEFYIALHRLSRAQEFNDKGIKWYWPYPITSYYELKMIINLAPSYLLIGPPLTFDLSRVVDNASGIPLRMSINSAHPTYLPSDNVNGICGQWVRPEDIDLYATKVQCFEFIETDTLKEEAVLLETYQKREWQGNLNLLIKHLNCHIDNRSISRELSKKRMNCGQNCFSGGRCKTCQIEFDFARLLRDIKHK